MRLSYTFFSLISLRTSLSNPCLSAPAPSLRTSLTTSLSPAPAPTTFDLNRARALALVLDPDLILTHALDLARAFDLARALDPDLALNLYIILFLLQKRTTSNFPAYEGILLVKERQRRSDNPDV